MQGRDRLGQVVQDRKGVQRAELRQFGLRQTPQADGLVGVELQLAWPKPTRPGMKLQVFSEVVGIVPSRSKPNMAIVAMRNETRDQDGQVLQVFTVKMPVFKRP